MPDNETLPVHDENEDRVRRIYEAGFQPLPGENEIHIEFRKRATFMLSLMLSAAVGSTYADAKLLSALITQSHADEALLAVLSTTVSMRDQIDAVLTRSQAATADELRTELRVHFEKVLGALEENMPKIRRTVEQQKKLEVAQLRQHPACLPEHWDAFFKGFDGGVFAKAVETADLASDELLREAQAATST